MSKSEMFAELRRLMQEALMARSRGAAGSKLAHTQGLVDGYMRAMLDAGHASQAELLRLVAEERVRASGPALGPMRLSRALA